MTMALPQTRIDVHDLLAFYAEAGVDEPLNDAPVNRFAQPKAAVPLQPQIQSRQQDETPRSEMRAETTRPSATKASIPDEQQVLLARELAVKSANLDELREHMLAFNGCNLKHTAKNLVFADGNPNARLMLVGEAPGRDEDVEGRPFVGKSGQLLDRILAAIGLDRTSVYIANVIPWRPPGNRTPTPHEIEICRPFIERQIELVNPKVLVNVGGASAKAMLATNEGILRLRGNWRTHTSVSGAAIPAMPTLHPAYLLRTPAHKALVWRDFLEVKMKLRSFE